MLKNIPEVLPPELLLYLMEMGHGDEIVIGDSNFPARTMSGRCVYAKGVSGTAMLDAILQLMPLDIFVDDPVVLMETGPQFKERPPIWDEYQSIVRKHDTAGAFHGFVFMERFEFYARAKRSFVTVGTSELSTYACVILTKGIITKDELLKETD